MSVAQILLQRWPQDDEELWEFVATLWGIRIPRLRICSGHRAPFEAFADAFFARSPVAVWKASRGLGGKSFLMAALGLTEMVVYGADVTLLGGSGAQSARLHEYMQAGWGAKLAPRRLLTGDPSKYETTLSNGGRVRALMASQTSARGPHPQRLRMDEVDEVPLPILNAALGQPMATKTVPAQTVLSSTHHNPDGTMTEVLRRATANGWPVFEWCFRETSEPHGWLPLAEIERKKSEVPASMWATEFEGQEPSPEARAIVPEAVEAVFDPALGSHPGKVGYVEFESPQWPNTYATGADWARDVNWTIIVTFRTDCSPWRVVAFTRAGRQPWPQMVEAFNRQVKRYEGSAAHDETGLGNVVADLLGVRAQGVTLTGRLRSDLFAEYIACLERGELKSPRIEFMYGEHKYVRNQDLYGAGHPPDTFVAGALARWAAVHGPRPQAEVVYELQSTAKEKPW